MMKLKTYKGVDIFVTEHGTFVFNNGEEDEERASLDSIIASIDRRNKVKFEPINVIDVDGEYDLSEDGFETGKITSWTDSTFWKTTKDYRRKNEWSRHNPQYLDTKLNRDKAKEIKSIRARINRLQEDIERIKTGMEVLDYEALLKKEGDSK